MADDVSRKISKLRDEGMPQDQAVAAAMEMTDSDSPPMGVQGFSQTPNATSGQPAPPDKFTQTPDRSDPSTAPRPADRNKSDAAAGPPGPVQNFGSGAEQRGVTTQTLRTEAGPATPGEQNENPEGVQSFDQGADV